MKFLEAGDLFEDQLGEIYELVSRDRTNCTFRRSSGAMIEVQNKHAAKWRSRWIRNTAEQVAVVASRAFEMNELGSLTSENVFRELGVLYDFYFEKSQRRNHVIETVLELWKKTKDSQTLSGNL